MFTQKDNFTETFLFRNVTEKNHFKIAHPSSLTKMAIFCINVSNKMRVMQETECNFHSFLSQYCHNLFCTPRFWQQNMSKHFCQSSKKFILIWVLFSKYVIIPILGTILNSLIFQYPPAALLPDVNI